MTATKGSYSTKAFLQALRMAAEKEDLAAIDDVLDQAADGAYGEVARAAAVLRQPKQPTDEEIKKAICDNLAKIIEICDELISSPGATPEDIAWAKAKKKKAQKDQKKRECSPPPVA